MSLLLLFHINCFICQLKVGHGLHICMFAFNEVHITGLCSSNMKALLSCVINIITDTFPSHGDSTGFELSAKQHNCLAILVFSEKLDG